MSVTYHIPVMVEEVFRFLRLSFGSVYTDGCAGTCGHCLEAARLIGSQGTLVGVDLDPEMLAIGKARMEKEFLKDGPRMVFRATSYERLGDVLEEAGIVGGVDGILLDLGVNSLQIDSLDRGMSFKGGPLDGRFNRKEGGMTIRDFVNTASEKELATVLRDNSDERYAKQIARRIVAQRQVAPIETGDELAKICSIAYPPAQRYGRLNPATRTMQALRIYVNQELDAVERGVRNCLDLLAPGGRMVVLSFHSGEDKLVKKIFKEVSSPRPDPANPYQATTLEGIRFSLPVSKAVKCSVKEAEINPRARSTKLRVIERRVVEGSDEE